jgi:hypothetical protein
MPWRAEACGQTVGALRVEALRSYTADAPCAAALGGGREQGSLQGDLLRDWGPTCLASLASHVLHQYPCTHS